MLEYDRINVSEGIGINKTDDKCGSVLFISIITLLRRILVIKHVYAIVWLS